MEFRYLLANPLDGVAYDEVFLTDVSYSHVLNGVGDMSGTFSSINNPIIEPGRTAIFVQRNNTIDYAGIVWGLTYNSETQQTTINARDYISYLEHRRNTNDLDYSAAPLWFLVSDIFTEQIRGVPNSLTQLNYEVLDVEAFGITASWIGNEYKPFLEIFNDLSKLNRGFEYRLKTDFPGSAPATIMQFAVPKFAVRNPQPSLMFPGDVLDYQNQVNGGDRCNRVLAVGAGALRQVVDYNGPIEPQLALDTQLSLTDYTDGPLLHQRATTQLFATVQPVGVPALTCYYTEDWDVMVGDTIYFSVAGTQEVSWRVSKLTVTAPYIKLELFK